MPNWKITRRQHEEIIRNAEELVERRTAMAQTGFPLTNEEVQLSVMDADDVATLSRLRSRGFSSIETRNDIWLAFDPETHGTQRTTLVQIGREKLGLYLPRDTGCCVSGRYRRRKDFKLGDHFVLTASAVAPERMALVVKWVDNVVREHRLAETAVYAVKYMTKNYIDTTADIAVKWPLLEVLMRSGDLKSRVAHVPKHTKRYEFQNSGPIPKLRQVAEAVLLAADMLLKELPPRQPTEWWANLGAWVPKPGDWKPGDHS